MSAPDLVHVAFTEEQARVIVARLEWAERPEPHRRLAQPRTQNAYEALLAIRAAIEVHQRHKEINTRYAAFRP